MRITPWFVVTPVLPFFYYVAACDPEPPRVRSAHDYSDGPASSASAQTRTARDGASWQGDEYCRDLATKGTSLGNADFTTGVVAGAGSLGVLTLGTTVASNDSHSSNAWDQNRGTILSVASLPLAVMAYYYLSRANAAYEAAAQANDARNQSRDAARWHVCNTTWSAWDRSHASSDAIVRAALNEKLAIQSDAGTDFPELDGLDAGTPSSTTPPAASVPPASTAASGVLSRDGGH